MHVYIIIVANYFKTQTRYNKLKFIFIILLFFFIIINKIKNNINKLFNEVNDKGNIKVYEMTEISNVNITNNVILIVEIYPYHYECTSGFAKYFIDLGYNVDILMHEFGKDSLCLFEHKEKIRLFIYKDLKQIHFFVKLLIHYMSYYPLILLQTTTFLRNQTISDLELLRNDNTIYVFHSIIDYELMNFSYVKNHNRIWTLGHFNVGLQVNPHYFGKIKLRDKNKKTRFFITSTAGRNYKYIVSSAEKLKNENFEFEIFVIGHGKKFSINNINEKLKDNFIFNYSVNYSTLYETVYNSDFIIINLDPDKDHEFKKKKLSGSAQLSYGFLKPALINDYFKDNYNMTNENSFLFKKNNFYNAMKNAILLNNEDYKKMQRNLLQLSNAIYNISLLNVIKALKSLLFKP